jgi:glutathione S-transferase
MTTSTTPIQLYYVPSMASMAPHFLLEELGVPYTLIAVDMDGNEHQSESYRQLNPNGLIPVLVHGDLVMYETAAICLHLADTHPTHPMMPAVGTAERAHAYKWLSWLSTTLQQTLMVYFYPHRWADSADAVAQVKQHAQEKALVLLAQIDQHLATNPGPWMLGEHYSVLDLYSIMLCRWTRHFEGKKARDFTHIGPWLGRVLERPATQRVFEREGLQQPWV